MAPISNIDATRDNKLARAQRVLIGFGSGGFDFAAGLLRRHVRRRADHAAIDRYPVIITLDLRPPKNPSIPVGPCVSVQTNMPQPRIPADSLPSAGFARAATAENSF